MKTTRDIYLSAGKQESFFQLDESTRKQLQKLYLEICQDIFLFCEKHHLTCMLGGGSLLGAIRHKGFIPWDDDLDLNMPREDYNLFAALFTTEYGDKYEIFVPDGKHRITNLFMKVSLRGTLAEDIYTAANPVKTGVSIDIFPIEEVPANHLLRSARGFFTDFFAYAAVSTFIFQNRNAAMRQLYCSNSSGSLVYYSRCLLGSLLSFRKYTFWYCLFDRYVQSSAASALCTVPTGRGHFFGELRAKEIYYPVREGRFEHLTVKIPNQAEKYLTDLYGDYQTPPPPDRQERHMFTRLKL